MGAHRAVCLHLISPHVEAETCDDYDSKIYSPYQNYAMAIRMLTIREKQGELKRQSSTFGREKLRSD